MNELIKRLTKETGVTRKQAEGGLVALLRAGEKNMARKDFEQFVADVVVCMQLLIVRFHFRVESSTTGQPGDFPGRGYFRIQPANR